MLVLERETFPRFHIGESQLPWINEILTRIGADEAVAAEGFVQKWGASFTTADGEADQYADFSQAYEVPRPQTYQVPRARFDQVLLETRRPVRRARAAGLQRDATPHSTPTASR